MVRLILASGSPRRLMLLRQLGIEPDVVVPDVDETPQPGETPGETVERLAATKCRTVDAFGAVVIAADTLVVLDGVPLGKPADEHEARRHLRRLSGRTHDVVTGVAVRHRHFLTGGVASSRVGFVELSAADIDWYVATGEPVDKAGSYAVQGAGGMFVEGIDGPVDNVIGLPRRLLRELFDRAGLDLLAFSEAGPEPRTGTLEE